MYVNICKGMKNMYPKIKINKTGIIQNAQKINEICSQHNVQLSVVTKLLSDNKEIVSELVKSGIKFICDSKIENLISYSDLPAEKWLIRLPSLSEVPEVIKYTDASLNSELSTIQALNEEAQKQGKVHKIILMYELGDLREGCLKNELKDILSKSLLLKNIEIYGIGTNLSCYGEILPDEKNMTDLANTVSGLEKEFNIKFKIISGGNSTSYPMLINNKLPTCINNLRIGETIYLGKIPCIEEYVPELFHDNFILQAQIIELKEKPSIPWGTSGNSNSFGEHHTFEDKGIRKRAIIGLGRQDIKIDSITPKDTEIEIIYGSSDHIILDLTDCEKEYKVGDIVEFDLNYSGVLSAMTSKYVKKEIEK